MVDKKNHLSPVCECKQKRLGEMAVKENFISFLTQLEDDNSPLASSLHMERTTLVQLQQQVVQLCQQRDSIKQQLEMSTKQLELVKNKSGIIEEAPKLDFCQQKKLLEELLDIYGLMGIQVCYSKKNNVLLKFTSTSDGLYRCTYSLELHVSDKKIDVDSYDLPPFIPMDKILSKKSFNVNDICSITKEISNYLHAYTVRDKDIHDIQELYGPTVLSCLQCSLARELVSFKLVKHDCALDCKLSYLDLLAVKPDEISVQCTDLALRYSNKWLHHFQESSGMSLAKMKLPLAINSILQAIDVAAAESHNYREFNSISNNSEDESK